MINVSAAQEPAAGTQVEQKLSLKSGGSISYLFYLPADYDASKTYPLMLFLHGRGESNGPLSLVAKWGPPRLVARGDSLPYILVSPQCPAEDQWRSDTQQTALVELLDHVVSQYPVDKDRVYLTGLSMGGYGTWRLAADHPERFAAAAPICGGGDPAHASKLTSLPLWVFHGDQDTAVPYNKSVEMVEAIRAAGGERVRFTTLEHVGHNSWSAAYATPELYEWFDKQRASKN
jgi:predicted peptidase